MVGLVIGGNFIIQLPYLSHKTREDATRLSA
jgi:hypothetical protein